MCLIAVSKTGKQIPREHLQNAYWTNDDGSGWAYSSDDTLFMEKGLWSFHEFYSSYEKNCVGKPHLIHLRNMSAPPRSLLNTHPFYINKEKTAVLVHNGNIRSLPTRQQISDTRLFVDEVIAPLTEQNPNWYTKMHYSWMVENAIGEDNKLAIIDNLGFIKIFNEKQGEWDNEIWYSNSCYKHNSFLGGDYCGYNRNNNYPSNIYQNDLLDLENFDPNDEKTLEEIDKLLEAANS